MSRTLRVTGNHVIYDRGAWFLKVMMSSSRALCCLSSVKKQKLDFQACFVDRARHRKNSWRQGLTNTKKVDESGKVAICWLCEREKLREPEEKKELAQTVKTFHVEVRKKGFVSCRFGFCTCDIQNSQGLSKGYQPQPSSTLIILDITKTSPNNCLMLILEKAIHRKLGLKDDLGPVDTPNINRVKVISLFCTAHRPVSILLLLQVWRWFSPVTEK